MVMVLAAFHSSEAIMLFQIVCMMHCSGDTGLN